LKKYNRNKLFFFNSAELTIFAFAFLDKVLILDILMAGLAVEPGSGSKRNHI
jgi:hypothetical protein